MAEKKRVLDGLVDLGADKDDDECFRKAVEAVKNGTDRGSHGLCFSDKSIEEEMDECILNGWGLASCSPELGLIYHDRLARITKHVHELISRGERPNNMPSGLARIYEVEFLEVKNYAFIYDDSIREDVLNRMSNLYEGGRECFLKAVETVRNNFSE